jgi:hypothetical protein
MLAFGKSMKTFVSQYDDASEMSIPGARFLRPGFLDSFLGYLAGKRIDTAPFMQRLAELLGQPEVGGIDPGAVDSYLVDCPNLSGCRELARSVVLKRLSLAQLKRCPVPEEVLKLTAMQYLRGVFVINYYILKALTCVMSKDAAIRLFNDFSDNQTRTKYNLPHLEKVADLLSANSPSGEVFVGGHNVVEFELDEGRVGCKVTRCKWHEVLKDFNDPELEYAVICHYDFEAAKCHNANFALTREETLAQGHACCDFIWHDTRIDKEPVHPKRNFWDSIQVI